jgi:nitrate/TMAO reductase-like tetraheme cytochrome c subunit
VIGIQFSGVASVLRPAAALQQAHAPPADSVALQSALPGGIAHSAADSVVVQSPLPGGIARVVRFLLNTVPQWVQIGGVVLGVVVAAVVIWFLYARRVAIRAWLTSRTSGVRLALAAIAVVLIAGVAAIGTVTWNYTQHSNDFCVGCHIMNPAFQKFGDTTNKHAQLSCHDCHQQSLYASARQVYLWVAERPEKIGPHARVPNKVCETCHVTRDTAAWQRVASTAGHRVHLESDSSALKNIQCVKCHGVELHRFASVNETCGQSGCHKPSETNIALGKMAEQTDLHCISCHAFTADVPLLATRDSARGTLVPGKPECLGCHKMQKVLADFDAAKDPHGGKCGTCHNPHLQKTAAAAANSCTTSGCHSNWRDTPFHVGAAHKQIASRCLTCHVPHAAKVDASDCEGCHRSVRSRGGLRPPLPFDTTKALRRAAATPTAGPHEATFADSRHSAMMTSITRGGPGAESDDDATLFERDNVRPAAEYAASPLSRSPPSEVDSFPHARHAKLACLVCHVTGTGAGLLTFKPPRGCAICHHQAPASSRCATCHEKNQYMAVKHTTMTVTVPGHDPRPRPVDFFHAVHTKRACLECHTTPVTLALSTPQAQCKDCHSDHHAAGRNCSACHTVADPKLAHQSLETAHQRCDACHTATTIAELTPTRSFCSTCHAAKAKGHYDQKECTVCHFLAEPGTYRSRLITTRPE